MARKKCPMLHCVQRISAHLQSVCRVWRLSQLLCWPVLALPRLQMLPPLLPARLIALEGSDMWSFQVTPSARTRATCFTCKRNVARAGTKRRPQAAMLRRSELWWTESAVLDCVRTTLLVGGFTVKRTAVDSLVDCCGLGQTSGNRTWPTGAGSGTRLSCRPL